MGEPCSRCGTVWGGPSGEVCDLCRSLGRLVGCFQGAPVNPSLRQALLVRVRTWTGETQDLIDRCREAEGRSQLLTSKSGSGLQPPGGLAPYSGPLPPPQGGVAALPKAGGIGGDRASVPPRREQEPRGERGTREKSEERTERKESRGHQTSEEHHRRRRHRHHQRSPERESSRRRRRERSRSPQKKEKVPPVVEESRKEKKHKESNPGGPSSGSRRPAEPTNPPRHLTPARAEVKEEPKSEDLASEEEESEEETESPKEEILEEKAVERPRSPARGGRPEEKGRAEPRWKGNIPAGKGGANPPPPRQDKKKKKKKNKGIKKRLEYEARRRDRDRRRY